MAWVRDRELFGKMLDEAYLKIASAQGFAYRGFPGSLEGQENIGEFVFTSSKLRILTQFDVFYDTCSLDKFHVYLIIRDSRPVKIHPRGP